MQSTLLNGKTLASYLKSSYIKHNKFDGSAQQLLEELSRKVYCGKFIDVDYDALYKQYPFYAKHLYNNGLYRKKGDKIKVKTFALDRRSSACVSSWLSNIGEKPVPLEGAVSLCIACGLSFEETMEAIEIMCDEDCIGRNVRKLLLRHWAKCGTPIEDLALQWNQVEDALQKGQPIGKYAHFYNSIAESYAVSSSRHITDTETVVRAGDDAESYDELLRYFTEDRSLSGSLLAESTQLLEYITAAIKSLAGDDSTEREYLIKCGAYNLYVNYTLFCRGEAQPSPEWFLKLAIQLRFTAADLDVIRHRLAIENDTLHAPLWDAARTALGNYEMHRNTDRFYEDLDDALSERSLNQDYEKSLLLYQSFSYLSDKKASDRMLCYYVGNFLATRLFNPYSRLSGSFLGMNIPRLLYVFNKTGRNTSASNHLSTLREYLLSRAKDDYDFAFMTNYIPRNSRERSFEYCVGYWFRGFVYTVLCGRIYRHDALLTDCVGSDHPLYSVLTEIQALPDSKDFSKDFKAVVEGLKAE